jgi:hypothetical protein
MTRSSRHRINAAIGVLVLAHGIYRFVANEMVLATDLRTASIVAEVAIGLLGAVWFWFRSLDRPA